MSPFNSYNDTHTMTHPSHTMFHFYTTYTMTNIPNCTETMTATDLAQVNTVHGQEGELPHQRPSPKPLSVWVFGLNAILYYIHEVGRANRCTLATRAHIETSSVCIASHLDLHTYLYDGCIQSLESISVAPHDKHAQSHRLSFRNKTAFFSSHIWHRSPMNSAIL